MYTLRSITDGIQLVRMRARIWKKVSLLEDFLETNKNLMDYLRGGSVAEWLERRIWNP